MLHHTYPYKTLPTAYDGGDAAAAAPPFSFPASDGGSSIIGSDSSSLFSSPIPHSVSSHSHRTSHNSSCSGTSSAVLPDSSSTLHMNSNSTPTNPLEGLSPADLQLLALLASSPDAAHSLPELSLLLSGCLSNYLTPPFSPVRSTTTNSSAGSNSSPSRPPSKMPPSRCHALYKTELCRGWLDSGTCRYGGKCQFAHGPGELRQVPRHPKYKTELCRSFAATGSCSYGSRCRFIHSFPNATAPSLFQQNSNGIGGSLPFSAAGCSPDLGAGGLSSSLSNLQAPAQSMSHVSNTLGNTTLPAAASPLQQAPASGVAASILHQVQELAKCGLSSHNNNQPTSHALPPFSPTPATTPQADAAEMAAAKDEPASLEALLASLQLDPVGSTTSSDRKDTFLSSVSAADSDESSLDSLLHNRFE